MLMIKKIRRTNIKTEAKTEKSNLIDKVNNVIIKNNIHQVSLTLLPHINHQILPLIQAKIVNNHLILRNHTILNYLMKELNEETKTEKEDIGKNMNQSKSKRIIMR